MSYPSLFSPFFWFFSFLSCSFLSITDSLGSDPHTHWDEGGNYCANMRIFCILLNFPTQNYTLYPRFCLIIHLLHLLKSFGKVMWSGKLSCEKKTRAVWWLLSQLKVRNRTLIHFFCFVPTVQNLKVIDLQSWKTPEKTQLYMEYELLKAIFSSGNW